MKVFKKSYSVAWSPKTKRHEVLNTGKTFWGGVTRETAIALAKRRNAVEREVASKLKKASVTHKEMAL